jgi:hypothetical protein
MLSNVLLYQEETLGCSGNKKGKPDLVVDVSSQGKEL